MECTGLAATWCPNCGDCTCPVDEDGQRQEEALAGCPLHDPQSNHPLPTEGRAIVLRPDSDPDVIGNAQLMGIPIIRSTSVPEGMMFVVDLDLIQGKEPLEVRTALQAEEFMERMRKLVENDEIGVVKGVGDGRDG